MSLTKKFNKFKRDNTIKFFKFFSDERAFRYFRNYVKKNTETTDPREYVISREQIKEMLGERASIELVKEYCGLLNVISEVTSVQLYKPAEDSDDNLNNENDREYFFLRYTSRDDEGMTLEVIRGQIDESEFNVVPFKNYENPSFMATVSVKNMLVDFLKKSFDQELTYEQGKERFFPISLNIAANRIAMASRRGAGNVLITSPENAEGLLKNIYENNCYDDVTRQIPDNERVDAAHLSYEFTINGLIRVYSSSMYDYVTTEVADDADYLMCYNGISHIDSGLFVCVKSLAEENEHKTPCDKYAIKPVISHESCDLSKPEHYMIAISK